MQRPRGSCRLAEITGQCKRRGNAPRYVSFNSRRRDRRDNFEICIALPGSLPGSTGLHIIISDRAGPVLRPCDARSSRASKSSGFAELGRARRRHDATERSVGREIRGIDVHDHPAIHVGAFAGEVPTAAYRSPHRRVLASRRPPDVPARGLQAASSGAAGIRAEHPQRGDDAQRQAHGDKSTGRDWRRKR